MEDSDQSKLVRINFEPIQKPLMDLAETVAQKVRREGPALLNAPPYVAPNMFVMLRHAMHIYDFLFYIHADERRQNDCYWKSAYTFVSAPLIRSLIDYLYNLTLILQDPSVNGAAYCKSGFRNELRDLDEDEARYGGNPNWEGYLKEKRGKIHLELRKYGLTFPEIQSQTPWPTMGKYIADKQPGAVLSPHQEFLKTFTFGMWREYSAMAHGGFEGLLDSVSAYTRDAIPHESRPIVDEIHHRIMSMHMIRTAVLLLCIVTELQAYFRFSDASINTRIRAVWKELTPAAEAKELYDLRYAKLMEDRGINP